MGYPDVITMDGRKMGKFVDFRPGPDGRLYVLLHKVRIAPGTAKTFKKRTDAIRYLLHLYKKAQADPKKYKPLLALLEDEGYDMLPLDDPRSEMLISSDQVVVFQRDSRWVPFPIQALLENSPSQRNTLLELYTLYTAYLKGERPKLYEQLRLYQQIDEYNSRLINTLMYENDRLMRMASEYANVINSLYRTIADLNAMAEFFHHLYETYRRQGELKDEVIAKFTEMWPQWLKLLNEVREQVSRVLDLSMEATASEWSSKQTIVEALKRFREQLRELERQASQYASPTETAARVRAAVQPPQIGGEKGGAPPEGGEEGGEEAPSA